MAVLGGYRLTRTGVLFIVGILVLGGLVTGSIFLVKNHGEAVRHGEAVKIAQQNLEDQSKTDAQATTPSNESDTNATAAADTDTTPDTATTPAAAVPAELPVTGIDDVQLLGRAAVLAIVALSGAYYVASRRAARGL